MYLSDAKIISSAGKNYLQIDLEPEYGYEIIANGVKKTETTLYFEEPEAANLPILKSCAVSIERLYQHAKIDKQIGLLSKLDDDQITSIFKTQIDDLVKKEAVKQVEKSNLDPTDNEDYETAKSSILYINFIASLLNDASTYDDGKRNYFDELQRFIDLLNDRIRTNINGQFLPSTVEFNRASFGKPAQTLFLKEAIVAQYVGFFFSHFPSKSLNMA